MYLILILMMGVQIPVLKFMYHQASKVFGKGILKRKVSIFDNTIVLVIKSFFFFDCMIYHEFLCQFRF